jgi:hypothetical protein
MQFRWVASITLWTFLSGPILAPPRPPSGPQSAAKVAAPEKPAALSAVNGQGQR